MLLLMFMLPTGAKAQDSRNNVVTQNDADAVIYFSNSNELEWEWNSGKSRLQSNSRIRDYEESVTTISILLPTPCSFSVKYYKSAENYEKFGITLDNQDIWHTEDYGTHGDINKNLSAGVHTLYITYSKDDSDSEGDDCIYLWDMKFTSPETYNTIASGQGGPNIYNSYNWDLNDKGVLKISGNRDSHIGCDSYDNTRPAIYHHPWDEYKHLITSIIVENGIWTIDQYSFTNCPNLSSLWIPASCSVDCPIWYETPKLSIVAIDDANPLFDSRECCNAIVSKSQNTIWEGCSGAKRIPRTVCAIGNRAYKDCASLESLHNEAGDKLTTIGDYAFMGCTSLSYLSGFSPKSIGRSAFEDCTSFYGVSSFYDNLTTLGYKAFKNCTELRSVTLPSTLAKIENETFSGCAKLNSVSIASNSSMAEIGDYAFMGCVSLPAIALPSSLVSIGSDAFYGCSSLQTFMLPCNLQRIGNFAFGGCSSLNNLMFHSIPVCTSLTLSDCSISSINLNLTDDSYIYTGSNPYMPTCTNATYTRSIAASSNWGTLVLPYTIASDENVQLYELTAVSDEAMTFTAVENVDANTPCVFKKKDAAATSLTFAAAEVNVVATAHPTAASVDGWSIKGTYERLTDQTGMFYIAQDGFWRADTPIGIKPFRAWLENSRSQAKSFSIFSQGDDVESTIEALEALDSDATEFYDLNGRRMNGLQKGINIIKYGQNKSKKVIIK